LAARPGDDRVDGFPGAAQQPADGGLVHPLRQPGHNVLEVAAVPGVGASPRHLLGPDPAAVAAVDAVDVGFQPHLAGAEV
jgi:hypothetical protein